MSSWTSSSSTSKNAYAKLRGAEVKGKIYKKGENGKLQTTGVGDTTSNLAVDANSANASSGNASTTPTSTANTADTATQNASGTSSLDEAKQRLLDSLDYTYGRKQELSDKSYDKTISQTDNAMLNRGMQRSSYSQQVLANLAKEKIEAAGDIESEKIAAYNTGVNQLEQQEREQQNWEKNYALQQESLQHQKDEAAWTHSNTERQIALSSLQAAAAAGNKNVSDALLAAAGISRKDFEQWIKNANSGKSGSSRGGPKKKTTTTSRVDMNANWGNLPTGNGMITHLNQILQNLTGNNSSSNPYDGY